jgi:hypothetical protein
MEAVVVASHVKPSPRRRPSVDAPGPGGLALASEIEWRPAYVLLYGNTATAEPRAAPHPHQATTTDPHTKYFVLLRAVPCVCSSISLASSKFCWRARALRQGPGPIDPKFDRPQAKLAIGYSSVPAETRQPDTVPPRYGPDFLATVTVDDPYPIIRVVLRLSLSIFIPIF